MLCDPSDVDSPSGQFHDKKHVVGNQSRPAPYLNREEVGRCQHLPEPNDIPHTDRKKLLSNTDGIRCTVNEYRYFDAHRGEAAK
jgi:hypothetical protein